MSLRQGPIYTTATRPSVGQINRYDATAGALAMVLPALEDSAVGIPMMLQKDATDLSANSVSFVTVAGDAFDDGTTGLSMSVPGEAYVLQVVSLSGAKRWKVMGTLQRTNTSAAAPVVNVKDYGATGNGSTNDTTAFQSARTAAGVGGQVQVPPGTYIVNNAALSAAHQRWEFAPGAHMKLPAGATNGAIVAVTGDYVTIEGGEWDGNRANVTTQLYQAPIMIVAAHCTVRDAYIHDTDGWGIVAHPSSTTTTIDGTVVEGCTLVDTYQGGINFDCITYFATTEPSSGVRVSDCWITTSLTPPSDYAGVGVVGSTTDYLLGATVENCHIDQPTNGSGFQQGIFWRYVTGMRVTGCYVSGTELAYTFDNCVDSSLVGCTAYAARQFGIELGSVTTRTAITGCAIDGANVTATGICADNGTNNELTITGNTIGGISTTGAGVGIIGQTGGRAWTISGNVIRAPAIGIEIYGASTTNMTIEGNTLDMEAGGAQGFYCGIYLDPFTTGARGWLVRNNNLIGWSNHGIQIDHGSSLVASNITVQGNSYLSTGSIVALNNVTLDNTCRTENWGTGTVASVAGTITLPPSSDIITLTGTATVTNITASYPGRRVTLINTSTASLADGGNLKLATAGPATADDSISLVCDGTNWFEVGRSVN